MTVTTERHACARFHQGYGEAAPWCRDCGQHERHHVEPQPLRFIFDNAELGALLLCVFAVLYMLGQILRFAA